MNECKHMFGEKTVRPLLYSFSIKIYLIILLANTFELLNMGKKSKTKRAESVEEEQKVEEPTTSETIKDKKETTKAF